MLILRLVSLFIPLSLSIASLQSSAVTENIFAQTSDTLYIDLSKKGNNIAQVMSELSKLDDQEDSLIHQLSQHIKICKPPYYCAVDPQTIKSVQNELRIAVPILHKKMLDFCANSSEEYFAPAKRGQIQIVLEEKKTPSKF